MLKHVTDMEKEVALLKAAFGIAPAPVAAKAGHGGHGGGHAGHGAGAAAGGHGHGGH